MHVIADGNSFAPLCKDVKFFVESREDNWCEFESILWHIQKYDIDEFVWLQATQPCRDDNLIQNTLSIKGHDLVTSYVIQPDRSIFRIEDGKFKEKNTRRTGSMCKDMEVADGAIYYTNKEFLTRVCASEDPNFTFWNSDIVFVENRAPLVDIDTEEQLKIFNTFYL